MRSPSPISASSEEHPFSAGGFAPWPKLSPQPPATARLVLCLVAFVAVLFSASLIVSVEAIKGMSRLSLPPVSSGVSAYLEPMEPAVLCSVNSGVCSVSNRALFSTKPWTWEPLKGGIQPVKKKLNGSVVIRATGERA